MIEHNRTYRLAKWAVITAFLLLFLLPFNSSLNAESSLPKVKLSVMPLDLSRAPSTEEIMAAGQWGGPLYPTEDIDLSESPKIKVISALTLANTMKIERNKAINLSFGEAIQKWNEHEFREAVRLFKQHVEQYPDSPWASEAILHVGCDATYHGLYSEAEENFNRILKSNEGSTHPGAKKLINKTRLRLAALRVFQNNFKDALNLFGELLQNSDDWRERTYASHWIQRLSRYSGDKLSMLNCGTLALARVLEKDGRETEARNVSSILPTSEMGQSMEDLREIALRYGYEFVGLRLSVEEIMKTPLPAIVQISGHKEGISGHYWVLEKREDSVLEFFDPQADRRYMQSINQFTREWDGNALVLQQTGTPLQIGELIPDEQLRSYFGGCCGAPPPPTDLGDPENNNCPNCCYGPGCIKRKGSDDYERERDKKKDKDPCGEPVWSVNMISMNLFVTDTPLWFKNPIGPSLEITLSYNSQSSITYNELFGNKWIFNYSSYMIMDTADNVTVFMPDGRHDLYNANGSGGYVRPLGVSNTLTKLDRHHFELKFPDGTIYEYDLPFGGQQICLVKITDRYGESLTFSYEIYVYDPVTSGTVVRLSSITDALGRSTTFLYTWHSPHLVKEIVDPAGRSAKFEYDASYNLIKITDMGGYSTTFTYDQDVYLTSMGNSRGTWSFYIEPSDNSGMNSDNYPPPGEKMWQNYRITVTDPYGAKEEYMYYAGCDSEEMDEAGCVGRSWYVSPKHYVEWQSQTINSYRLRSPKTKYFFNNVNGKRGRISSMLYPDGGRVSYTYFPGNGLPATFHDAHAHTISYTYNSLGFKTSVTDAKQKTTTMTYADNNIDVTAITNGLGTVTMVYDALRNLTLLTDRMGHSTTMTFDGYGRMTSLTDPLGNVTSFTYYGRDIVTDDRGQLKDLKTNGTTLSSFTYDSAGRVKTQTDASGLTLTYTYDQLDRVTDISYPDGKHESYVYSGCCPKLLDSHTDRTGLTTHYTYDALERLTEIRNPDDSVIRYEYDANGNLAKLIDTNGNATTFSYDAMDRLAKRTYADGNDETYAYDQADLLVSKTNARDITTVYTYDENHNLTSVTYSDGAPGVIYLLDDYGRAMSRADAIGTYLFSYDANSRTLSVDGPWDNDTLTYTYDSLGRVSTIQQQGEETIHYTYDALFRLQEITKGGRSFVYNYSPGSASSLPESLTRPNGSRTDYLLDALKRLAKITNVKASSELINSNEFTYNSRDLRGSETVTNGDLIASFTENLTTYDYNNLNQLLSSTSPNLTFSFDKDGNLTKGYTPEGYTFTATYDPGNRLKSLDYTDGASVSHHNEYYYTGNGLLAKQVSDGIETRYVRDGYFTLQERDASNSVTRSYLWGLGKIGGIGGLLEVSQGGQQYNYLYDGRGNVTALIDSSQSVAAAYMYDPFGSLMRKTGTLDQPYKFSTKPFDEKTGLSYYGHRFYSPLLRRWDTRDPIRESGGLNLYAFVGNSPLNYADPLGLSSSNKVPCPPKKYQEPEPPDLWDVIVDKWTDLLEVFIPLHPTISPVEKLGGGAEAMAKGLKVEKQYFNAVCDAWAGVPGGPAVCAQRLQIIQ
jgi:RHS repeat-associated protein